jgi:hypothetical protein
MRSGQNTDIIEAIPERGQFPLPYVPALDPRVLPTTLPPGEIALSDVRLWVLPSGFGPTRQLVPLVNRAHRGISLVHLHVSTTGSAPWEDILESRFFAAQIAVNDAGGISAADAVVRVSTISVDFARMAAQTAIGQTDDTLLLLIDNELMSVSTITVVAANTYDLGILRARKGTTAAAHADAALGFLFFREEMEAVEHVEFSKVRIGDVYAVPTATKYFKFQLFTVDEAGLAKPNDPGIAFVFPDIGPNTPTAASVTARTGYNEVKWSPGTPTATSAAVAAFEIFRHTSNSFGAATKIGENDGTFFNDGAAIAGTLYFYWVRALDANRVPSGAVLAGSVTTLPGAIGDAVPDAPDPASKTNQGTVQNNKDGTVSAWFEFSIPAKKANAAWTDVLMRRNVAGEFAIVGQYDNTSLVTVKIEHHVPGISYQYATRSRYGNKASAVVQMTGAPFVAPGDTTPAGTPTFSSFVAGDSVTGQRPPPFMWGNGANASLAYAATVNFICAADPDISHYELFIGANSDGTASLICDSIGSIWPAPHTAPGLPSLAHVYVLDPTAGGGNWFVRMRSVDFSGNRSGWVNFGNAAAFLKRPTGDLIEQNKSDVDLRGGKAVLGGFEANVTTAVDVKAVNLRVFDGGGTQRMRVDAVTGEIYVQGLKVLSTRQATPTTLAEVISAGQAHGFW